MALGTATFVTLFLGVFRPFGLHSLELVSTTIPSHLILIGYGVITGLCMILVGVCVPSLIPKPYAERSWTAGKEIVELVITIATIGLGNTVFTAVVFAIDMSPWLFLAFQVMTAAVGVFPATILVLLQLVRYRNVFVAGARTIEDSMHAPPEHNARPMVNISDDEGRTALSINADEVLLLTSADNYVECTIHDAQGLRTVLIRTSLRALEEAGNLPLCFWRCHRSHIVNLDRVDHVSGTAQGYRLSVGPLRDVAVSRSRSTELRLVLPTRSRIPSAAERSSV